jgi:hypothetical protein
MVRRLTPHPTKKYRVWDARVLPLCVTDYPSSMKSFYYVYSFRGPAKFYWMGPASLPIDDVRKRTKLLIARVAEGNDPQAERREQAAADTFEKLHARCRSGRIESPRRSPGGTSGSCSTTSAPNPGRR